MLASTQIIHRSRRKAKGHGHRCRCVGRCGEGTLEEVCFLGLLFLPAIGSRSLAEMEGGGGGVGGLKRER